MREDSAIAYVAATTIAVVAVLLRLALAPHLTGAQFITFFPAVVFAAYTCGQRSALLTAFLCGFAGWYLLVTPLRSFGIERPAEAITLIAYFATATAIAILVGRSRAALQREHGAREALLESEARLDFLDKLGTETALFTDAETVLTTTTRLLGEHLSLSVCAYADMDEDQDGFTIRGDWAAPGSKSVVGHYSLADFGKLAVKNLSAGLPLVVNDNRRELAPEEATTFQNIGIAATICMPLLKAGRLTALMAIHDRVPRVWTEAELDLLLEVTGRSWAHVERVGAVAELRASEARLKLALEAGRLAEVTFYLPDGIVHSSAFAELLGHPPDKRLTLSEFRAQYHPDDYDRVIAERAAILASGQDFYEVEKRIVRPNGQICWVYGRGTVHRDEQGRAVSVTAVYLDETDRKAAESALRESEARLRDLNETLERQVAERTAERDRIWQLSPDLMCVARTDGILVSVNPAWERMLGWPADWLTGRSASEVKHPEDAERTAAELGRLATGLRTVNFEDRYRHMDGSWRWISWVIEPEGELIYCIGRDVTAEKERQAELRIAQEALRQSQKLESMGQLTGGVAHDINNLLTPIMGSLDLLRRRGVGSEREQRMIDGALQSAERASVLVQRLLAFARRQPLQAVPVDVGSLVAGMAELIQSTSGPRVRVELDIATDLPPALADLNQLEMALLNLAVNSRDAMENGGTLTIAVTPAVAEGLEREALRPGQYVRLSLTDTGIGMDEEVRKRAVEPFYSTKGVGKGTGLGLSMVHGLAAQLGGALEIQSKPGLGTSVELWLPVSREAARTADRAAVDEALAVSGTALLVDDEELVRMSTADMLADLGFAVVEAASADEALRLVESGLQFDLLITDHLMAGMTGTELAREVRARLPDMPVLVVSGYAEVEGIAPDLPRLTKPFRRDDLTRSLAALAAGD
jgi:PAS domain S-box-containing protein